MSVQADYIYTMWDYYDGPREGIASINGRPYLYKSLWTDQSGEPDTLLLHPISQEVYELAMEAWSIWQRWDAAFEAGETTMISKMLPVICFSKMILDCLHRILQSLHDESFHTAFSHCCHLFVITTNALFNGRLMRSAAFGTHNSVIWDWSYLTTIGIPAMH